MTALVERECPRCGAVVRSSEREVECRYCGAQLVVDPPALEYETHEVHGVFVERVGPSNRERVVSLLVAHGALAEAEAWNLLVSLPCTIGEWTEWQRAHEVCGRLEDGGAGASVVTRVVKTPIPPPADVVLESPGPSVLGTIKALREHVSIALSEAKPLVQSAPCVVARSMPGPKAVALVDALRRQGAKARLD
jgi:ribosomal protein L7/L12/DNA-directed RNA polymerase subunit RPC12/RpoP